MENQVTHHKSSSSCEVKNLDNFKNSPPLDNLCYNFLTMNHNATVFTTQFNTAPVGISVGGVVALR